MSNIQKLNNIEHANICVLNSFSKDMGDGVMFAPIYPNEMRGLQSCYPLMFYKDEASGEFHPIALFGFEEGENLFLDDADGWQAPYIPLMIQRGPLMIGFEATAGSDTPQPVVAIDIEHPKVSHTEGQRLFTEHGGHTDYLDRMTAIMEAIHQGHSLSQTFTQTLLSLDLITSCDLEITLDNGSRNRLSGFYMIDDEKLQALSGEPLLQLANEGCLAPAYMMVASQSQLQALIRRKSLREPATNAQH